MARPSKYTPEIVDEVCERLCNGEPIEVIARLAHMPSSTTLHDWCAGRIESVPPSVSVAIARATAIGFDVIACNTRLVARGEAGYSSGDVDRDKLIIYTDLNLLSKWSQKYANKTIVGGDKDNPIVAKNVTHHVLNVLSLEQLEAIRAEASESADG